MSSTMYTINLVGDVMLGRLIDQLFPTHVHEPMEAQHVASFVKSNPHLKSYGPATPWGDAIPLFDASDLNMTNLETSVTASNRPWPDKVFNYRMHPDNLKALHPAKIDYASLANNHTLDFSEQGLTDTVEALKAEGVKFAGAGFSRDEATAPAELFVPSDQKASKAPGKKRYKVQVWSAADHPGDWAKVPGFHLIDYTAETRASLRDIITESTAPDVALKIFSVHWGPNYAWRPADEIQSLAHFLIDECGIDLIHGHSSHHIQGVETYRGKLIIYGCGDFVDDYALTEGYRNDLSAVWRVGLREDGARLAVERLEVFPTKIVRFQAKRLRKGDDDHHWVLHKFKQLCNDFGTKVEDTVGKDDQLLIRV